MNQIGPGSILGRLLNLAIGNLVNRRHRFHRASHDWDDVTFSHASAEGDQSLYTAQQSLNMASSQWIFLLLVAFGTRASCNYLAVNPHFTLQH